MNDDTPYYLVPSIAETVPFNEDSILSRPLFSNPHARVVAFSLAKGQEMTRHTSTMEAHLHIISGTATLTLGDDPHTVKAGTWVRMEPRLTHSLQADEDLVFTLTLFRDTD